MAACRMLGKAGYDLAVAASEHPAPAHWSRSCTERVRVVDPRLDPARFTAELERFAARNDHDILLPGSDATLVALARHGERSALSVRSKVPPPDTIMRALDKVTLIECAEDIGRPAPPTVVCGNAEEALAAAEAFGYPVVLKPRRSVFEYDGVLRQRSSVLARDATTLEHLAPQFAAPCLVQRREEGSVVSIAGVMADGRLLAGVASRYVRTWPRDAGSASYSYTIPFTKECEQTAHDFVTHLGWEGIFELELLERPGGELLPIDFNPRVYGSLALSGAAGVPLATIGCDWVGGTARPSVFARPGSWYRWEDGDLRNVGRLLSHGDVREAAATVRPRKGTVHAYLSVTDPLPALARAQLMGRHGRGKGRPRVRDVGDRRPGNANVTPSRQQGRVRKQREGRSGRSVVVIGAGPYGLSAAHFCRTAGAPVRIFGNPMEFWSNAMPAGMILRSRWRSSHIADPTGALSLDRYEREIGRLLPDHIAVADFIEYGRWYQRRALPDLDQRRVERVDRGVHGFELTLEDGESCEADTVILATGLSGFAHRPSEFLDLPSSLVSHTVEHRDLSVFAGKRVLVVGGGQSALESAALLREAGSQVEVLVRAESLAFLPPEDITGLVRRLNRAIAPPTDVGGRVTGWAAAAPDLCTRLPPRARSFIATRALSPKGADWLRPRLADITITLGRRVMNAVPEAGIRVTLDDGSERSIDHLLLGTGYEIDLASDGLLSPKLRAQVELRDGYPALGRGLESSVPGLHFVGAPAAHSFGPIMRFVVGTWYAAPAVAERATQRRGRLVRLSYRPRRPWRARRPKRRPTLPPVEHAGPGSDAVAGPPTLLGARQS